MTLQGYRQALTPPERIKRELIESDNPVIPKRWALRRWLRGGYYKPGFEFTLQAGVQVTTVQRRVDFENV